MLSLLEEKQNLVVNVNTIVYKVRCGWMSRGDAIKATRLYSTYNRCSSSSSSSKYRIDSKDRVKLSRRGDYKF